MIEIHQLQRAAVKQPILGFEVAGHNARPVKSGHSVKDLFESTVDRTLARKGTEVRLQGFAPDPRHDQVFLSSSNKIINHGENVGVAAELLLQSSAVDDQVTAVAPCTFDGHLLG